MRSEDYNQLEIEAIHARLDRQERRTYLILSLLSGSCLIVLGLLFFHVVEIQ